MTGLSGTDYAPGMTPEEIVVRFRRRWWVMIALTVATFADALIIAFLTGGKEVAGHELLLGIAANTWFGSFFALVLLDLLWGGLGYRCPACGKVPLGVDNDGDGILLNPRRCEGCGARLKA